MMLRIAWLALAALGALLTTPGIGAAADLAPVPEPATVVLVGAGAAAAGAAAWWGRRRRK